MVIRKAVGAIVFQDDKFLIIHKVKINTNYGKETIIGEWDFIKGGVEERDPNLKASLLRELKEETGSTEYEIVRQFNDKIHFEFPDKIKRKIGFHEQETTMFLVEFLGDADLLKSCDDEISTLKFIEKNDLLETITHQETKDYFLKCFSV